MANQTIAALLAAMLILSSARATEARPASAKTDGEEVVEFLAELAVKAIARHLFNRLLEKVLAAGSRKAAKALINKALKYAEKNGLKLRSRRGRDTPGSIIITVDNDPKRPTGNYRNKQPETWDMKSTIDNEHLPDPHGVVRTKPATA